MSELKSFIVLYDGKFIRAYKESEADKAIAELEESHKMEVEQLLIKIAELKKEKEYVIEHTADIINGQEQDLRHNKYKRCLAMARIALDDWHLHNSFYAMGHQEFEKRKCDFYEKWRQRWLAIAEKFKPNPTINKKKEAPMPCNGKKSGSKKPPKK